MPSGTRSSSSSDIKSSDIKSSDGGPEASGESRPGVRGSPARASLPNLMARSPPRPVPARTVRARAISSAARLASTSPPPAVGANLSRTTVELGACGEPSDWIETASELTPPARCASAAVRRPEWISRPPGPHPGRNEPPWKDCASVRHSGRVTRGLGGRFNDNLRERDASSTDAAMAYAVCIGGSRRLAPCCWWWCWWC